MAATTATTAAAAPGPKPHALWFRDIQFTDVAVVGGKNASLGGGWVAVLFASNLADAAPLYPDPEMYRELRPTGINIPNGFAITADAYFYFLDQVRRAWWVWTAVACSTHAPSPRPASARASSSC